MEGGPRGWLGEPLYFGMVALSLGVAAESWASASRRDWRSSPLLSAPDTRPARLLPCRPVGHQKSTNKVLTLPAECRITVKLTAELGPPRLETQTCRKAVRSPRMHSSQ